MYLLTEWKAGWENIWLKVWTKHSKVRAAWPTAKYFPLRPNLTQSISVLSMTTIRIFTATKLSQITPHRAISSQHTTRISIKVEKSEEKHGSSAFLLQIKFTYCCFCTDQHANIRHSSVQKIPCFFKIRRSVTNHVKFWNRKTWKLPNHNVI